MLHSFKRSLIAGVMVVGLTGVVNTGSDSLKTNNIRYWKDASVGL